MSERTRRTNSSIKTEAESIVVWPRYSAVVEPDLEIECEHQPKVVPITSTAATTLESSDTSTGAGSEPPHRHLVHSFPLFLLSAYFQKSILFSNLSYRPFTNLKQLKLPFSCESVQELIHFAYNSRCSNVTTENYSSLVLIADFTGSTRMFDYLQRMDPNQSDQQPVVVGGGDGQTNLQQQKQLKKLENKNQIARSINCPNNKTNGTTFIIDHVGVNSNDQNDNIPSNEQANNNDSGLGKQQQIGKVKHRGGATTGQRHHRNKHHHHKHNHKNNHHNHHHHRRQHHNNNNNNNNNNLNLGKHNLSKINF